MKKILLIAIALLLQVPVHAGLTYDQWCGLNDDKKVAHMDTLTIRQTRVLFLPKLEYFSRKVAESEGAALRSVPQGENSWFPKDIEGLYFEIRNFKDFYFQFVLHPYGSYWWYYTKVAVKQFLEEYDASSRNQLYQYPVLKAVHLMLRLHKAYGVKPHIN